jgi:Carbohydrate binding domain
VAQSVLGVLQPGSAYHISAWVRLANPGNAPVLLTVQKTDASGTSYENVAFGTANETNWTQLSGGYTFDASGDLTTLTLYLEGPAAGIDFDADDFDIESVGDWKDSANARIQQIRQREVRLEVVDAAGKPVAATGHGSYDATLTLPGGLPTLRRFTLAPGSGTNVVVLVATADARPVLHGFDVPGDGGPLRFQLTADAGNTYAIQTTTNLGSPNWSTVATLVDTNGTIWFSNTASNPDTQRFFRARLVP